MAGWGKLVAGALIGVAGTVYATNEEFRKKLPEAARDLPEKVRERVKAAVSAGRAASSERRAEILRDLGQHGGQHGALDPDSRGETEPLSEATAENVSGTTLQPDQHVKQGEQDQEG